MKATRWRCCGSWWRLHVGQALTDVRKSANNEEMPSTELLVFRHANGRVPMEEWLDGLPAKARAKCLYYMRLLAAFGHELRRPVADSLRDGIHELRPSHQGVPYRVLYFSMVPM